MLRSGLALGFLLAGIQALSPQARAEEAVATSQSSGSSSLSDAIQKYGKASYLLWMQGMHTETLSGNRDGTGTNLTADHFFAVGAALGKGYTIKLTNSGHQTINEAPEADGKSFEFTDPYITLSKSGLIKDEAHGINMDAYLRYYAPLSRGNADNRNRGAIDDKGRGAIRVYVAPSKSFFDGKLTFTATLLANFKLNSKTPQERFDAATVEKAKTGKGNVGSQVVSYRKDMYFYPDPSVAYTVSNKVEVYVEWFGIVDHTTNGKWTSFADAGSDSSLSPGINWTPTKKVLINPYIAYALSGVKSDRKIDKASIGLQMQYTFL